MKFKNENEIDVFRCLRALKKKVGLILGITLLLLAMGISLTLEKEADTYSASTTVYAVSDVSYSATATAVTAMNLYSSVATSNKVCNRAALLIGSPNVDGTVVKNSINVKAITSGSSSSVSTLVSQNGAIIQITAVTEDPALSMQMSDAVAEAFVLEMGNIVGTDAVQVLDQAYTYKQASSGIMQTWKLRIIFAAIGFVLSCLMIVFFEIFDTRTKTIRECSIRNELPVIGVIPGYKK